MNYSTFQQYAKNESIENASLYASMYKISKAVIQLWVLRIQKNACQQNAK